ncbi:hypothetical protein FQ186_26025 [Pseudomonas sp. ANT_H14]|uniref:hypothetical protein n=1 Tax=unclassified Pseudomonas TaxID=196821 RepID=UPI0011EF6A88|nr:MULTISPECIES: hypothetical protein [unclassified Pseudomonas]KAA0946200.1 hypothetical protein FQ182_13525 [Pseudomonas sp. ANT_H4]KAA0947164.1 hypothetical protein FQ186_26025 [Pseudomonas sp. ANT_H14]
MTTVKMNVTTDTSDLEQAPKSTVDALLANVKTSVLLKDDLPVAKDEFWDAVGTDETRQTSREQSAQHAEQAKYKATRVLVDEAHRTPQFTAETIQTVQESRIKN